MCPRTLNAGIFGVVPSLFSGIQRQYQVGLAYSFLLGLGKKGLKTPLFTREYT
jgi:hypothetical protein